LYRLFDILTTLYRSAIKNDDPDMLDSVIESVVETTGL